MTSNRLFSKTGSMDFRREISGVAIYTLVFFFAIPIALMLGFENLAREAVVMRAMEEGGAKSVFLAQKVPVEPKRLLNCVMNFMGVGANSIFLIVFAFSEAYRQFAYLHRKREVDFYHALPQSRSMLYASRIRNGIVSVLLPYACCLLLGVAVALASSVPFAALLHMVLPAFFINVVLFLLTYAICVLAVVLTGRALTGILGMLVLNTFVPCVALMINLYATLWFESWTGAEYGFLARMIECSPFSQLMLFADQYITYYRYAKHALMAPFLQESLLRLLLCLAVSAVIFLLALFLYKKRPLERAGEAMAFQPTEPFIRICLVLLCGMGGATFFYSMQDALGWAVFGMLTGVLISHCIIELIYNNDFKKLLKHWQQLAACVLVSAVLLAAFVFDWFGFDSYLPQAEAVRSASVSIGVEASELEYYEEKADGSWGYKNAAASHAQYMKLEAEDILEVLEIAEAGIQSLERFRTDAGVQTAGAAVALPERENCTSVRVLYRLANGGSRERVYHEVPLAAIEEAYGRLYMSEAYKNGLYPILREDGSRYSRITYMERDERKNLQLSAEQRAAFVAAYQKDLRRLSIAERKLAYPLAALEFRRGEWVPDEQRYELEGAAYVTERYPLYADFTETEACLAALGIDMGAQYPYSDAYALHYDVYGGKEARYGMLTEPAQLALAHENMVQSYHVRMNPFGPAVHENLMLSYHEEQLDAVKESMVLRAESADTRSLDAYLLANADTEALAEWMEAEAKPYE